MPRKLSHAIWKLLHATELSHVTKTFTCHGNFHMPRKLSHAIWKLLHATELSHATKTFTWRILMKTCQNDSTFPGL